MHLILRDLHPIRLQSCAQLNILGPLFDFPSFGSERPRVSTGRDKFFSWYSSSSRCKRQETPYLKTCSAVMS
eukprot:6326303-Ditylum_brightwellii.AAC.1